MQEFWFYMKMGLNHVLDLGAYDHMLFLLALILPFSLKHWKKAILLATMFTIAHCVSLYLSVYGILVMNVLLIEFLIPLTILATSLFNLIFATSSEENKSVLLHLLATVFFGLIHGFGFSNYFNMLMSEEDDKLTPLLGFAGGIEISQILLVLSVLLLNYVMISFFKITSKIYVVITSILIILVTIPMLITAFSW
ncbi:FIG00649562: hypothetical protein [hydrothermal vent metagenome]|uniref:HupE / UreJ protein n=1 Tax=hydrothermal vent metagenome TaxID=652676 RepID=A0A3B0TAN2_9ZZZZ